MKHISYTVFLALIFGITAFIIALSNSGNKSVYLESTKLYEDFILSKELGKELESSMTKKKKRLDSIYALITNEIPTNREKAANNENTKQIRLQQEYFYLQEKYEKEFEEEKTLAETKIWNQLNQYIADFGQRKDYSFILGASGNGNIMYGNRAIDITGEVINYVNQRYNGKEN